MRKILLLITVISLFLATSCSSSAETPSQPEVKSKPRYVISLPLPNPSDHYWSAVQTAATEKANEIGAELITLHAADAQTQLKQLEEEVTKGASGLAIAAIDSVHLAPLQKQAQMAKIPLVLLGNPETSSPGTATDVTIVGTDEEAAGRLAADHICNPENRPLVRNTEVAIIRGADSDLVSQARAAWGRWGLEDCSFKVVAEMSANGDEAQAENVAAQILHEHGDINALLVTDEVMAIGVAKAVKAADKSGKILIVTFGAAPETLSAIIAGDIRATLSLNPKLIGVRSIETLSMLSDDQSVPAYFDTGTQLITLQNASQFQ